MRRFIGKTIIVLILISLNSCTPSELKDVSIIAIIANPDDYKAKQVTTFGFLRISPQARLFINREDALNSNYYHSILLNGLSAIQLTALNICNNQYVSINAVIKVNDRNKLSFNKPAYIKGKPTTKAPTCHVNLK